MKDIHDIKLPLEISLLTISILISLIILTSIIIVFLLLKKEKQKNNDKRPWIKQESKLDYKYVAIRKLKNLEKKINRQELRLSFHELSLLVKEYLKNITKKNVIEMTAREIHHTFQNNELNNLMLLTYEGEFKKNSPKTENFKKAIELSYSIIKTM